MFEREINQLVNAIKDSNEYKEADLARKAINKNKILKNN